MNIYLNLYVTRIVTTCPHDYNTLKNEYKGLGGIYDVMHHTNLFLIFQSKRLMLIIQV